jgi:hypothetical protein
VMSCAGRYRPGIPGKPESSFKRVSLFAGYRLSPV